MEALQYEDTHIGFFAGVCVSVLIIAIASKWVTWTPGKYFLFMVGLLTWEYLGRVMREIVGGF